MLTLYDNLHSSNALKVRFLLHELGLAFESVEVTLDEERPDWYREIHPFGLVPCLVDGDLKIPESNTALRYLATREGRTDLYPSEAAARAHVDTLLDALSLQVRPALWEAEKVAVYGAAEDDDIARPLADALNGWERLLASDGYCAGPFTIADCAAAGRFMHLDRLPVDWEALPRTQETLRLAREQAAYIRALGDLAA